MSSKLTKKDLKALELTIAQWSAWYPNVLRTAETKKHRTRMERVAKKIARRLSR